MSVSRHRYFEKLRQQFPDNDIRGIRILRDCLIPRFELFFVNEARRAVLNADDTLETKLSILRDYVAAVNENVSVKATHKMRLRAILRLLETRNQHLVRASSRLFNYQLKQKHAT
jgi:hypothetical protein